jgi:hypothetical protein
LIDFDGGSAGIPQAILDQVRVVDAAFQKLAHVCAAHGWGLGAPPASRPDPLVLRPVPVDGDRPTAGEVLVRLPVVNYGRLEGRHHWQCGRRGEPRRPSPAA